MNINEFTKLSTFFSRKFAQDLIVLLVQYKDLSASEAASRLGLHIRTVQDWLEGMAQLGILRSDKVSEGKRPYNRYSLREPVLNIDIDLSNIPLPEFDENIAIREKKGAEAQFTTSARGKAISSISTVSGEGRSKAVRKWIMNPRQGSFLYYLPFPTAPPKSIREIMRQAGLSEHYLGEMIDTVRFLFELEVIERAKTA